MSINILNINNLKNSYIMEELKKGLLEQANIIAQDINKDTKAAQRRVRRATLAIAKLGKEYRKASLAAEKA